MATILQFRRAESASEALPQLQTAIGRMAEVIIFPGVRIDRQPEKGLEHANPPPGSLRPAQG